MEEPRPDAPELELTADRQGPGDDALQLGNGDTVPSAGIDDAFAMHLDEPAPEPPPAKATKPVTAEANASVVAALMGKPIPKSAKSAEPPAVVVPKPPVLPKADARPRPPAAVAPARPESLPTHSPAETVVAPVRPFDAEPFEITTLAAPAVDVAAPAFVAEGSVGGVSLETLPAAAFDVAPSPPPTVEEVFAPAADARPVLAAPVVTPEIVVPVLAPSLPAELPKADRPARPASRGKPVTPAWSDAEPAPTPKPPKPRPAKPKAAVVVVEPERESEEIEPEEVDLVPAASTGAWWTIPFTVLGIAIVACAILVPAAEDTRRDTYELAKIERDVDYFQKQSEVNAEFLKRVNTDATLAERLAMRQLHQMRPNTRLADLSAKDRYGASPYAMTRLDPPAPLPPYRPTPGKLTEWFVGDKRPQQMAALGLLVSGLGVMFGGVPRKRAA